MLVGVTVLYYHTLHFPSPEPELPHSGRCTSIRRPYSRRFKKMAGEGDIWPLPVLVDAVEFPLFEHLPIDHAQDLGSVFESIFFSDVSVTTSADEVVLSAQIYFSEALPPLSPPGLD